MSLRPLALPGLGVALLMITNAAAAQQPAPVEADTAAITPAMVAAGRSLFHGKGTCFACHGMNLEGTQAAPTLIKKVWRDAKGGEYQNIFFVITHGVPSTVMVAFPGGVSRTEATNLASYIWSINNRKEKP